MLLIRGALLIDAHRILHHGFQGNVAFGSYTAAVFIFRGIVRNTSLQVGDLHAYFAPLGWHADPTPAERLALFLVNTYAQGGGLSKNKSCQPLSVFWPRQNGEQHAGPVLFHLQRCSESFERTLG